MPIDAAPRLSVLGPVRLHLGDEPLIVSGRLKQRLLSRLALTPEHDVSADALIDALWGDEPPRTARASLHVHLSHLRDRLRSGGAGGLIETSPDGCYRLALDRASIDAWRFETLAGDGRAAVAAGQVRRARDLLGDAIELWGEPFAELADLPAALADRHRLTVRYETACDDLAESLLQLGELSHAVPLAAAAVATQPVRERPYLLLARMYLELSEHARAIEVIDLARSVLVDEMGATLSDEMRSLSAVASGTAPSVSVEPSREVAVDIATNSTLRLPSDVAVAPLIESIVAAADADWRRVAHVRLSSGGSVPSLAPLLELVGLALPHRLGDDADLRTFHAAITHRIVTLYSAAPVLVIEGFEHADDDLANYLRSALGRAGPDPFTVVLIDGGTPGAEAPSIGDVCPERAAPPLPVVPPVAAQLARLAMDELTMLELLAMSDRPAAVDVVAVASGLPVARSGVVLEQLVARNLVALDDRGRLDLATPAVAEEIAARLGEAAAHRHLALADALARQGHDRVADRAAEARHRLAGLATSDDRRAWRVARAAAEELDETGGFTELIRMGDALSVDWPDDPDATVVSMLVGRAHLRAGHTDEGRRLLSRAANTLRDHGSGDGFAEAVRYLAEDRSPQRTDDTVRGLVEEALANIGPEPTDTRIQLMTDHANHRFLVDPVEAESLGRACREAARGAPSGVEARAVTGYIQTLMRPDTVDDRLRLAIEAQQLARRAGSTESLVLALTYEAMALVELGRLRQAIPPLQYADALAAEVDRPRFRWWSATWRALVDFALGGSLDVEDRFRAAFDRWPSAPDGDPFDCLASQLALLRLLAGRGAELAPALDRIIADDGGDSYLGPAALAFAQAGDDRRAAAALERLLAAAERRPCADIRTPMTLALAAEAADLLDAEASGARLAERIAPIASTHVVLNIWGGGGFYWGSLHHAHALALRLAGHRAAASKAREAALAAHERAEVPIFLARSEALLV